MQQKVWEQEYKKGQLVSKSLQPQKDFFRLMRIIKKLGFEIENKNVLDLGSGTGRNSLYLSELGANVTGMEISDTAIAVGEAVAKEEKFKVEFLNKSIGDEYPFDDNKFDLVMDLTSSNSLDEKEREVYLNEVNRVLKPGGYLLIRTLTKDGDKNAKKLLELYPAGEKDTYILPEVNLKEHVWIRDEFEKFYGEYFEINEIWTKEGYCRMNNQSYKRKYILAVLVKK
ncbi:hypothetical protein COT97_05795 [Candidatus Falkowbacteria bacterium CG10_big_fil_rev_8_21_14_0_10_39_11]|uniref:Methyltransferase domain-containing protein n=1 Tax=Candidatus Falkowbacteria bacterium CG10_big_fil_rev_8_21_14_0_10_39_11 TaxID=1974565 RepID=A0A2H0V3D0_9BACT|nr:MAG: hypothetical protein COT97_05795 [Candidatus Falkowbacteria bacterium CG10_big_fil_rev_8_21_14_0_10_39_11]